MTDFRHLYKKYIKKVDNVIFPSLTFAKHYGTLDKKNLYFGSTKYDYNFDNESNLKTLKMTQHQTALYGDMYDSNKLVLVVYPRQRDINNINFNNIIFWLKEMGYHPVIKTRAKDPVTKNPGCPAYEDEYWYPHVSLDLINASKFVVNTGSTIVKECIMYNKPVINLQIKPEVHLPFLYKYNFHETINPKAFSKDNFIKSVNELLKENRDYQFKECIDECLFEKGKTSKKILNYFAK